MKSPYDNLRQISNPHRNNDFEKNPLPNSEFYSPGLLQTIDYNHLPVKERDTPEFSKRRIKEKAIDKELSSKTSHNDLNFNISSSIETVNISKLNKGVNKSNFYENYIEKCVNIRNPVEKRYRVISKLPGINFRNNKLNLSYEEGMKNNSIKTFKHTFLKKRNFIIPEAIQFKSGKICQVMDKNEIINNDNNLNYEALSQKSLRRLKNNKLSNSELISPSFSTQEPAKGINFKIALQKFANEYEGNYLNKKFPNEMNESLYDNNAYLNTKINVCTTPKNLSFANQLAKNHQLKDPAIEINFIPQKDSSNQIKKNLNDE